MKRILLLAGILACIAAARIVFAQEGVITYEVKINAHRNLPPERQEMRSMIPEFRISHDQLAFTPNESQYKPIEEEEDDEFDNGGGMRMRFQRPRNETYTNREQMQRIRLLEFMGKKYLIEDTLKVTAWKFGSETKEIQGHLCRQATFYNEETKQEVTAWYTDQLRPFIGPESFNTLPGAVLQVDINNGERVITATKIELRPLKKHELRVPTGGTKTTETEFRKFMEEQMERMRANGGNIIIRN